VFDNTFDDNDDITNDGILQFNASNSNSATGGDQVEALVLDGSGNLFVAGYTSSSLGGTNAGLQDGFIAKLNATTGVFDNTFGDNDDITNDGILQFNASNSAGGNDYITALVLDGSNLFAGGYTDGSLGGTNAGGRDGFILQCDDTTGVIP